jgi:hypothetical protein
MTTTMRKLPAEILLEIMSYLPRKDCKSLSLASQQMQTLTLPLIFGHLSFAGSNISVQISSIHQARNEIKEVIRFAFLTSIIFSGLLTLSTEHSNSVTAGSWRMRTTLLFSTFWRQCQIFVFSTIIKSEGIFTTRS